MMNASVFIDNVNAVCVSEIEIWQMDPVGENSDGEI